MLIRARYLWSPPRAPLEGGWIRVQRAGIVAVGSGRPPKRHDEEIHDYPEGVIIPGLCNAHNHLEYPDLNMAPGQSFPGFLRSMRNHRHSNQALPRQEIIFQGAVEGTKFGESICVDHLSAGPLDATEFPKNDPYPDKGRFIPMLELLGGFHGFDLPREKIANSPFSHRRPGLAPHSPYTTGPALLERVAKHQEDLGTLVSVHTAESQEEEELYRTGKGELVDLMAELIPGADYKPGRSLLASLTLSGLVNPRTLLVHGNYFTDEEIEQVGRAGAMVVHCPASHRFFRHKRFSWNRLKKAGARILLGTDSKATGGGGGLVSHLSAATQTADASPHEIWDAATRMGAEALGLGGLTGRLETGFSADILVLQNPEARASNMAEDLLDNPKVLASIVQGRFVTGP